MEARLERLNPEIEQLKQLLFKAEADRLQSIQALVDALNTRVGTPKGLERATAEILVEAFRRAELNAPRELAAAVAPSVVSAIRAEIKNSRGQMIEALYPITGRLVTAAVANAFRELIAQLQRNIDDLTSIRRWRWRLKSWLTRRPVSEIAISESGQASIRRMLLIERGSGRLLASWMHDGGERNDDIVGGMISAILEFTGQAFSESGQLRTLDFGDHELLLRASPNTIFAVETSGTLHAAHLKQIDEAFLSLVDLMNTGANPDDELLARTANATDFRDRPTRSTARGRILLTLAMGVFATAILWHCFVLLKQWKYERHVLASIEAEIAVAPILASNQFRLDFDHKHEIAVLTGIASNSPQFEALQKKLSQDVAPYQFESRVTLLASLRQVDTLQTRMGDLEDAHAKTKQLLKDQIDTQAREIDALKALLNDPDSNLVKFLAGTAIFFARGDAYTNSEDAAASIGKLAALLLASTTKIRVVGYADESGPAAANRKLARSRAERVAHDLEAQGIASTRLVVVSRSSTMPIADAMGGVARGNRRVIFEKVFNSETGQ